MKDAKGHGSNPRGGAAIHADSPGSRSRRGVATGFFAAAKPKYGENTAAARTANGGQLSRAAAERITMRQGADSRFANLGPPMSITDRMAAMSLGQGHPKSDVVPLGSSFSAAKSDLARGRSVALPRGEENRRKS